MKLPLKKNRRVPLKKNRRAISPVISILLLIVVAVAAGLVVLAWGLGIIGLRQDVASEAITLVSAVNTTSGAENCINITLRNTGSIKVKLVSAYIKFANGTMLARHDVLANAQVTGVSDTPYLDLAEVGFVWVNSTSVGDNTGTKTIEIWTERGNKFSAGLTIS